jgi:hypothetical protein
MTKLLHSMILSMALVAGSVVHAQIVDAEPLIMEPEVSALSARLMLDRDALGLPGLRPRLTMSIPLRAGGGLQREDAGPFSWSLEAWQLNTASLAHIQCHRLTSTIDSYLAEDCRFVDQPIPEHAVNLVQVRGEWAAAPGLSVGVGAFSVQPEPRFSNTSLSALQGPAAGMGLLPMADSPSDGLDFNISFGIAHDRVGDFLVGLQLARYRHNMSLLDLGMSRFDDPLSLLHAGDFERYANSAQLAVGWRRGSFSGDLLASSREVPLYLGSGQYAQAPLNSFDLEFSWRAVRNASITIGVSNVLDAAPRGADEGLLEPGIEDPLEHIFGRIPYVRYKHDL